MATYWKLSRTSIGNYDFRKTQVEKDARYLYRHGDYLTREMKKARFADARLT